MLQFETAQDRLAREKKVNILLTGPYGIGKTYAARTLDPATTLFLDGEAGTLALEKSKDRDAWAGTTLDLKAQALKLNVHPWEMCRAIACVLHGPDTSQPSGPYSQLMYNNYVQIMCGGNPNLFDGFKTIFLDSATVASRWCFNWCLQQPENISEKTKKLDTRSAYGMLGTQFVEWATYLQHQKKNIIMATLLDEESDEFKRKFFKLQLEGGQSREKLPGIFDVVLTLANVEFEGQGKHKVFVTQENNPFGYPAKDRSGLLEAFEQPDLGKLIKKIQGAQTQPIAA